MDLTLPDVAPRSVFLLLWGLLLGYACSWSSGIWISTATGSTAAMAAAGGVPMDLNSSKLQYMVSQPTAITRTASPYAALRPTAPLTLALCVGMQVREHLVEQHSEHLRKEGHGMLKPGNTLHLRWNSQVNTGRRPQQAVQVNLGSRALVMVRRAGGQAVLT